MESHGLLELVQVSTNAAVVVNDKSWIVLGIYYPSTLTFIILAFYSKHKRLSSSSIMIQLSE